MKLKKSLLLAVMMIGFSRLIQAQDIPVKGVIQDEEGKPVAGVNVVVQGESYGTTTDKDGRYAIDTPTGDVTLVFMLIGHKKFQQKFTAVNGRQYMLDVKLVKNSPGNALMKSYGEMDELKPQ